MKKIHTFLKDKITLLTDGLTQTQYRTFKKLNKTRNRLESQLDQFMSMDLSDHERVDMRKILKKLKQIDSDISNLVQDV